jgi:hypothetical protein
MSPHQRACLLTFVAGLSATSALRFGGTRLLAALGDQTPLHILAELTPDLARRILDLIERSCLVGQLLLQLAAHLFKQVSN